MAGDVVLNLVVSRGAQEESAVHQGELLKHRQGPVAQGTVDHVPLAGAQGRQYKPIERHRGPFTLYWFLLLKMWNSVKH